MRQQQLNNKISLRFRRWSRAGFAVFRSLGRIVTIGCVKGGIAAKEMLKAGLSFIAILNADNGTTDEEEEKEELPGTQNELILVNQTLDFAAAGGRILSAYKTILSIIAVEVALSYFNRFFIYSL